jgi:transcriptional regulator with XRE-family HTH domain
LIRELAHQNVNVSNETIRKWLAGEAVPRRDKMAALAKTLKVDETWLAMGAQPVANGSSEAGKLAAISAALKEIRVIATDPQIIAIIDKVIEES